MIIDWFYYEGFYGFEWFGWAFRILFLALVIAGLVVAAKKLKKKNEEPRPAQETPKKIDEKSISAKTRRRKIIPIKQKLSDTDSF